MVIGVYGPCVAEFKSLFFQELEVFQASWTGSWCICGDFNEVLCLDGRMGDRSSALGSRLFANFVDSHGLRDVPIVRASFTWSNMQSSPSLSKIDRVFLSAEWDRLFPFSKGLARPRPVFDNISLALCGKLVNGVPKPFKFENMWIKSLNFVDRVKDWWDLFVVTRKPGQKLRLK